MDTLQATTLTNGQTVLREETIQEFAERLRGPLITPNDENFDAAWQVWNGMIDKRPALIARCGGTADVIDAVNFARENDLLVAVRGGGHNVAGTAVCNGGLMIDVSSMDGVDVDPDTQTARVEGGATWGGFDHESQRFGLATTGGVDSRTGVAGLTLGGGIGWLARSCGLACDNVVGADVVTADGDLVHASRGENPGLFWGLRGGGGTFGVVTSLEFDLHEVGPEVAVAQVFHPFEDAEAVLQFYREFMAGAPDEVACYAFLLHVPPMAPFPEEYHGETSAALVACYNGAVDDGRAALEPLEAFGDPIVGFVEPMPYTALQQNFDDGYPDGERYYGKSAFIEELSDNLIDDLVAITDPLPGPRTGVFFESMGGAISRVDRSATAFPHRDAPFNLSVTCGWSDPAKDDEVVGWAKKFYETIVPYSTGGVYMNYLDRDDDDQATAAFRENYDRLVRLKNRWDPENLFQMNQNFEPSH